MQKIILSLGAIGGMLSVAIGAFGAHALKERLLQIGKAEVFETAVKYQFYHAIALLIVGLLYSKVLETKYLDFAGYCFVAGIIIFSGSLYILSLSGVKWWGAVTPIGGLAFIAGWICLLISVAK